MDWLTTLAKNFSLANAFIDDTKLTIINFLLRISSFPSKTLFSASQGPFLGRDWGQLDNSTCSPASAGNNPPTTRFRPSPHNYIASNIDSTANKTEAIETWLVLGIVLYASRSSAGEENSYPIDELMIQSSFGPVMPNASDLSTHWDAISIADSLKIHFFCAHSYSSHVKTKKSSSNLDQKFRIKIFPLSSRRRSSPPQRLHAPTKGFFNETIFQRILSGAIN